MDANERMTVIAAACAMAGSPGEDRRAWEREVARHARDVYLLGSDERSLPARMLTEIADTKKFVAQVVKVEREVSSNRGLITLLGRGKGEEDTEVIRTGIVDKDNDWNGAYEQVRALSKIVGNDILVFKGMELTKKIDPKTKQPYRVGMLRHFVDLGEHREVDQGED